MCLLAPKRVCLDVFEWIGSQPFVDVDRALVFWGGSELTEAINRAFLQNPNPKTPKPQTAASNTKTTNPKSQIPNPKS